MGRAKLSMALRSDKRTRRVTFEKRRKGLEKKAYELSTLCGVKIGMILYGPADGDEPVKPIIWPENHNEIENLISSYKKRSDDDCRQRTYDLSFFFKDQVKKVQEELMKMRKKNIETKYPNWDKTYDSLTYDGLKYFGNLLQAKIETVKSRINLMKGTQIMMNQNQMDAQSVQEKNHVYQGMLYNQHQQSSVPTYDPQIIDGSFNMANPSVMVMPMNDGASCSSINNYICNDDNTYGNYMYGSGGEIPGNHMYGNGSEIPINYMHGSGGEILIPHDSRFGMLDNVSVPNGEPSMFCYFPTLNPIPQFLQYPMFSSPFLQLQAANTEDYCEWSGCQPKNSM
ncbi:MADS-box transcription factor family protein [Abeliophyllum distichum]|uniref:MADS-box transcription factor family protein n=1 Tax=Abeliophyllum distichum TaxID=126358 RepID=A0ABD1UMA4_9LAMI